MKYRANIRLELDKGSDDRWQREEQYQRKYVLKCLREINLLVNIVVNQHRM